MGKILSVNGSPRKNGNTSLMLQTVLEACKGHDTEMYQAGGNPVQGCKACGGCGSHVGRCTQDDWFNELYSKMAKADAIILGSPTYVADVTPEVKAVIDRACYVSRRDNMRFSRKIGASVTAARRAGSIQTLDSINHFFFISDMIVPGSNYWNMSLCKEAGGYEQDKEGIATMHRLGENIAWLLEKLKA
ncbi:MAG: flavodoxin family protein [Oscillospiraceae bacterium]|nr:flavodoxin family protein [Oscillospiraceae bacterium]